jgi:nicotinate-nucleotide pyrophosphorylase (carboxylating)
VTKPAAIEPTRLPKPNTVDDHALRLIDLALAEDSGGGDWTTRWTVAARTRAVAEITAKAEGIVAGLAPATAVFLRLDPRVEPDIRIGDAERVAPGDMICRLSGPARALLTGERVALNFLQRLSGVATLTRQFVEAVHGTGVKILDTRKTTPGWRGLEKAAVLAGGGENHRRGLFDAVLIKENHVALTGGLAEAIARVREQNTRKLPLIVEVHSLAELDPALDAGVDRILFDNLELDALAEAVRRARRRRNRPQLEASGNMTLERVRAVAGTGVDFISVGAITHSPTALDLSLRILRP